MKLGNVDVVCNICKTADLERKVNERWKNREEIIYLIAGEFIDKVK